LDLNAGLTQVLADGTNSYLYGLNRIGEQQPGGFAYHLPDALGSVRQLTNASGSVTLAKGYQPYGSTLSSTGNGSSNYAFTGEWQDNTGLMHLRARYYSAYLNQFIQPDPIVPDPTRPQAWNRYTYGLNNPLKYVDRDGRAPSPADCAGKPDCGVSDDVNMDPVDQYFASLSEPYVRWPSGMALSKAGFDFIKSFEGLELSLYNDGVLPTDSLRYDLSGLGRGHCTIGYGHLVHTGPCDCDSREDRFRNGVTQLQAGDMLRDDVKPAERFVRRYVKVRLTQPQYDVLVSLVFNWGGPRFIQSDKLKFLNRGQYVATAKSIREGPVTSNGVRMPGLVRRRAAEADMFMTRVVNWAEPGDGRRR
jgi:RHS repeat-associated protein